jgi:nucleoid DNA-binding protein
MTTTTDKIMQLFTSKVDTNITYNNRDMQKILSEAYKEVAKSLKDGEKVAKEGGKNVKERKQRTKRERDDNGDIIKKRAPSAYNLFIKEQSAKIKAENPDLNSKVIFKMAIDEWKKFKSEQSTDDEPAEKTQKSNEDEE